MLFVDDITATPGGDFSFGPTPKTSDGLFSAPAEASKPPVPAKCAASALLFSALSLAPHSISTHPARPFCTATDTSSIGGSSGSSGGFAFDLGAGGFAIGVQSDKDKDKKKDSDATTGSNGSNGSGNSLAGASGLAFPVRCFGCP